MQSSDSKSLNQSLETLSVTEDEKVMTTKLLTLYYSNMVTAYQRNSHNHSKHCDGITLLVELKLDVKKRPLNRP